MHSPRYGASSQAAQLDSAARDAELAVQREAALQEQLSQVQEDHAILADNHNHALQELAQVQLELQDSRRCACPCAMHTADYRPYYFLLVTGLLLAATTSCFSNEKGTVAHSHKAAIVGCRTSLRRHWQKEHTEIAQQLLDQQNAHAQLQQHADTIGAQLCNLQQQLQQSCERCAVFCCAKGTIMCFHAVVHLPFMFL